jgi:hypothetical protein
MDPRLPHLRRHPALDFILDLSFDGEYHHWRYQKVDPEAAVLDALCVVELLKKQTSVGVSLGLVLELVLGLWLENQGIK